MHKHKQSLIFVFKRCLSRHFKDFPSFFQCMLRLMKSKSQEQSEVTPVKSGKSQENILGIYKVSFQTR